MNYVQVRSILHLHIIHSELIHSLKIGNFDTQKMSEVLKLTVERRNMAYSDFTLKRVKSELKLRIVETESLFSHIPGSAISDEVMSSNIR